jgi:glycosyltransferase involved in cell wall biosynthesis
LEGGSCRCVIYNPVITTESLAKALQPAGHPWLDENEYPVILAVGRLTEQKNHELLIRAFAQVIKQRKVRLVILGEGELRPRLQHLINIMGLADVVDMPGFVPNPLSYMNRAAVLAMSSSWEALPTSLIEALSLGVPVVSTNCPSGPAEILKDGQWGRLVQPDNPAAFARALLESLDSGRKTVPPESWQAYREEIAVQNYLDAIEKSGLCHRPQVVAKPLMS